MEAVTDFEPNLPGEDIFLSEPMGYVNIKETNKEPNDQRPKDLPDAFTSGVVIIGLNK